jgi:hypothetical protein
MTFRRSGTLKTDKEAIEHLTRGRDVFTVLSTG